MFGCKRDTPDRLLRVFLDEYHLNLLRWPRTGVEIGQVLVQRAGKSVLRCQLGDVFAEAVPELVGKRGVVRAPMTAKFSGKVDARAAIGFMEGLAATFGVSGRAKFSSAYEKADSVSIRVRDVMTDEGDVGRLSRYVGAANLQASQTLYREGDRMFVVVGVTRARAIELVAFDAEGHKLGVDVRATGLAKADTALEAEDEGGASIIYRGRTALAFGVELVEVVADEHGPGTWRLDTVESIVEVRGSTPPLKPQDYRFVEGEDDGSAFFEWP